MPRLPREFENHPMPYPEPALFRAHCRKAVDGDTVDLLVDGGFLSYIFVTVRLKDINTPELRGVDAATRKRGLAAKARLAELVEGKPVQLRSWQHERTFERWVGQVMVMQDGAWVDVGAVLVAEGHAATVRMGL